MSTDSAIGPIIINTRQEIFFNNGHMTIEVLEGYTKGGSVRNLEIEKQTLPIDRVHCERRIACCKKILLHFILSFVYMSLSSHA